MFTKIITLAIVAACGVPSTPTTTEPPPEQPDAPGEMKPTDQHFCCQSVDLKTLTGEGCTAISNSLELINTCASVLYCEGNWGKQDGKVQCE